MVREFELLWHNTTWSFTVCGYTLTAVFFSNKISEFLQTDAAEMPLKQFRKKSKELRNRTLDVIRHRYTHVTRRIATVYL